MKWIWSEVGQTISPSCPFHCSERGHHGWQSTRYDTREGRIVVQAGAFGEHRFDHVQYVDGDRDGDVGVAANHLEVELPPGTSIHLRCGLDRFTNRPSYAIPWHGE